MSLTRGRRVWRWTTWWKLVLAGWRPNRNAWRQLTLPRSFAVFPMAKAALAEFGNLKFQSPSETVDLDPSIGDEIAAEIKRYEEKVGRPFYPVGIIDGGDTAYVLIDAEGIVYALTDQLEPFALTFDRAIEYLVHHRGGRDEGLASVGMLGSVWRLDDGPTSAS